MAVATAVGAPTTSIVERLADIKIHDVDTHVSEPADLWTSRMSPKWGDEIPHIADGDDGRPAWYAGSERIMGGAGTLKEHPIHDDETWAGGGDPVARLRWMDAQGIASQV